MRLTLHTDYAMRVLLHLGANTERLVSIAEIAAAYGISRNHLMKVVQTLSKVGLVSATRGRSGGLRLGRPAEDITVGDVVRETEDGFRLVDCSQCRIAGLCELPPVLNEATSAFLAILDRYTVYSMLKRKAELQGVLGEDVQRRPGRRRALRNPARAQAPHQDRSDTPSPELRTTTA